MCRNRRAAGPVTADRLVSRPSGALPVPITTIAWQGPGQAPGLATTPQESLRSNTRHARGRPDRLAGIARASYWRPPSMSSAVHATQSDPESCGSINPTVPGWAAPYATAPTCQLGAAPATDCVIRLSGASAQPATEDVSCPGPTPTAQRVGSSDSTPSAAASRDALVNLASRLASSEKRSPSLPGPPTPHAISLPRSLAFPCAESRAPS